MLDPGSEFEALLEMLKQTRRADFTGYKRESLWRRFEKRMQMVGVLSLAEYRLLVENSPEEAEQLLDTILINVTSFFRDMPVWEYLRDEALPKMLAAKGPHEPIRVWSAGCATGAEAYTLAILLAEALGLEAFRARVKIYATDLDLAALQQGRASSYSVREASGLPPEMQEKYFTRAGGRLTCHKDLRRAIIFARHDLLQDAPISRIDLLACRNVLMYFNADVQSKVLTRLHFAMGMDGVLIVGKAEMLASHSSLFAPLDLKRRIFTKVSQANTRERLLLMAKAGIRISEPLQVNKQIQIQDVVLDSGTIAQVVINRGGFLSLVNEQARSLFRLTASDLGRPLQDLELSYRPAELRSLIDKAYSEHRPVSARGVNWPTQNGTMATLDLLVVPLLDTEGQFLGASITFADVTPYRLLQEEMQSSTRELETAYEELQSTNEELETTYEELQSTIEELETTNEELQSTNEELETMNEELQTTNNELQTLNGEVVERGDAIDTINDFMHSILSSLRGGVVVLDQNLLVQVWNAKMEDLWGLRPDEAQGQHFWNLDIGLPVEKLNQPIRNCLTGKGACDELLLPSHNRKGREILCRVTITPLLKVTGERQGVILLMEEQQDAPKPASS